MKPIHLSLLLLLTATAVFGLTPEETSIGLPALTDDLEMVEHEAYVLGYSESHEQSSWVAYQLTSTELQGTYKRRDNFRADPMVESGSAALSDYAKSGFDRGHLAPAADMKWSKLVMSESFFMSNMSPQVPSFNRGIWKKLEGQVRDWALHEGSLLVVTGPILTDDVKQTIGGNLVTVPKRYYKVLLDLEGANQKGIVNHPGFSGDLFT